MSFLITALAWVLLTLLNRSSRPLVNDLLYVGAECEWYFIGLWIALIIPCSILF